MPNMKFRSMIKIILMLGLAKKTRTCKSKPSSEVQARFHWYDGEIWELESRVRELESELEDRKQKDLLEEAYVEDYNDAGFREEENSDYVGEEFDDFYGEYFPQDKIVKRDVGKFIGGLAQAAQQGLQGNIIGGVSKFFSTILQPAFEYLIGEDDDHTMSRFTQRALPHDTLTGPESLIVKNAVKQGNGETVWSTVSGVAKTWNPQSIYWDDDHKDPDYLQCRKIVPLVDKTLTRRLQDVSLAFTSLITSLHDTQKYENKKGFAKAEITLDWILNTTRKLASDHNLLQELLDVAKDESMEMITIIIAGVIIIILLLAVGLSTTKQRKVEAKLEKVEEELQGLKEAMMIMKDRDEAATRSREATQNLLRGLEAAVLGIASRIAVEEEVRRIGAERSVNPGHPLQAQVLPALPLPSHLPVNGIQAGLEQAAQGMISDKQCISRQALNRHSRQ